MSIKRVVCPGCQQSLNVPASMASTKCPACGTVFSPANPNASAPAAPQTPLPESNAPRDEGKMVQWLVAGAVATLAVVGLILLTFLRAAPKDDAADQAAAGNIADQPAAEKPIETPIDIPDTYEVVDLPESTRKSIYHDYQQMIGSSFGKARKIPKSGAAGKALRGMLTSTVEREIKHMALIHNVSEDDILQIVAEGDAKDW